MEPPYFSRLRKVLIPVARDCVPEASLRLAQAAQAEAVLLGLVKPPVGRPVSRMAGEARKLRERLREMAQVPGRRLRGRVRVTDDPLGDLQDVAELELADLTMLEWPGHIHSFQMTRQEQIKGFRQNLALVRGPQPEHPARVLVALRGDPNAELALRLALALRPVEIRVLHIDPGDGSLGGEAFQGLDPVLRPLPQVEVHVREAEDVVQAVISHAKDFDLVIVGLSGEGVANAGLIGPVSEAILERCPVAVVGVQSAQSAPDEVGAGAEKPKELSSIVDRWFAECTFSADEFEDLEQLVALKQSQQLRISLALPALNEEATVGKVIGTLRKALAEDVPLLDEIVLMDSNSTDRTREIADSEGAQVYIHQAVLEKYGSRQGKGEALWKSLYVTTGDIIAWIDTDIVNIHPRFVFGIVGPLLSDLRIQLVKGFYRRPLKVGNKTQAGGGGRVTELTARPLINMFYPELSGLVQPLSGEYAGRRVALERVPFFSGYGVEIGLLIELLERHGLWAISQVDLRERVHHNQPLDALGKMSFAIIQAVMHKLERRQDRAILENISMSMKLIRYGRRGYFLELEDIVEEERPPMITIAEYQQGLVGRKRSPRRGETSATGPE